MVDLEAAEQVLRQRFGLAALRPAQRRVVASVLRGRDALAVLPTGAGKSVCYQLPAVVLGGVTVVVSPLIALMDDQVRAARRRDLGAAALHSALPAAERAAVLGRVRRGELQLLYVAPESLERLAPELAGMGVRPALLAVDEAHCISEWGHDFRPSYRRIGAARRTWGMPPTLALTGSATPDVRADICASLQLGAGSPRGPDVHVTSFDRPNLAFAVRAVRSESARRALLAELLVRRDGLALAYLPTRLMTESVARTLARLGLRSAPYHAGLAAELRREILDRFLDGALDVVCATSAFGMGIDQPRVRLVVHWTAPASPEAYYQEAGRAGRDGGESRCVLLAGPGDAALRQRQLEASYPGRRTLERLWRDPEALRRAARPVREAAERWRGELLEGAPGADWGRLHRRRRWAEARLDAMERYARTRGCRRAVLLGWFGEPVEGCQRCDRCAASRQAAAMGRRPAAFGAFVARVRALLHAGA